MSLSKSFRTFGTFVGRERTHPSRDKFQKKTLTPTLLLIQITPYIANEEAKKFLFDLIYGPDRLTGFFKLSAEKNGLIAPLFKNKL
jgi:hypothetical protein